LDRTLWKKWAGYHVRSRVEARMSCLKLFGERIMSRDPDRQTAGIEIRIAIMNRFSALGRAEIEAVRSRMWKRGQSCSGLIYATSPVRGAP
jgi:hypothetical protein